MVEPVRLERVRTLRGQDVETGATVLVPVFGHKKKKTKERKVVSMVNVGTMKRLELSTMENRILWVLLDHVPERSGTVSFVQVSQIAKETGIHPANVSKVMKALRDRRIVKTIRQGQHHVNAWIAYSGDFTSWSLDEDIEPEPIYVRNADAETGEIK